MVGGAGNDTYLVDDRGDLVIENVGGGFDTVRSTVSFTLTSNVEDLELDDDAGAINGTGNDLANRLTGNNAANVLDGRAGADTMGATSATTRTSSTTSATRSSRRAAAGPISLRIPSPSPSVPTSRT